MGKVGRENQKYSAEFKIVAIMDMREHHLGYREMDLFNSEIISYSIC
jgi:hypothetical protein